jgi:hypothetical protein
MSVDGGSDADVGMPEEFLSAGRSANGYFTTQTLP